jgi:hypothetical protein
VLLVFKIKFLAKIFDFALKEIAGGRLFRDRAVFGSSDADRRFETNEGSPPITSFTSLRRSHGSSA